MTALSLHDIRSLSELARFTANGGLTLSLAGRWLIPSISVVVDHRVHLTLVRRAVIADTVKNIVVTVVDFCSAILAPLRQTSTASSRGASNPSESVGPTKTAPALSSSVRRDAQAGRREPCCRDQRLRGRCPIRLQNIERRCSHTALTLQ
jgi:hypothetical protein